MKFRQVHLDFHTSEWIPDIGCAFDKKDFQDNLIAGHVDSITLTAKCAHGWSYYDSRTVIRHPHLEFDLLKEMLDAAHEIDVKAPVYLSVGLDEKEVRNHPEWLIRGKDERTTWVPSLQDAGWHRFCINNPYQDIVIEQIREVVSGYDLDGLFLDVSSAIPCHCQSCVKTLIARGQDPMDMDNVWELAEEVFTKFSARVKKMVHDIKPGLPIFHNGGHIQRGRRDLIAGDTHLELESLPTGGWGYDHLPMSALYVKNLGYEYLGMTGKFHTEWGEFGGFKLANGLRYETSLCLAYGARCSIGDQLHPSGKMDQATYELIGKAYGELEQKEMYVENTRLVQDIAILSLESLGSERHQHNLVAMAEQETLGDEYYKENLISQATRSDVGALRLLKECGYLFDIIDQEMDFDDYKVILLPDYGVIDEFLEQKLLKFMAQGGRLFLSGISGKREDSDMFMDKIPLKYQGESSFQPVYVQPGFELKNFENSAFVVYGKAHEVAIKPGAQVCEDAQFLKPYFNRTMLHFCSHMHAPCSGEYYKSAVVSGEQFVYVAFHMFEEYKENGSFIVKDIFQYAMDALLKNEKTIDTTLPSEGIVTLAKSTTAPYYINHLLYATPVKRGDGIEIIEDIVPLFDIQVEVQIPENVIAVCCVPSGEALAFEQSCGMVRYTVPKLECHQMIQILFDMPKE